MTIDDLAQVLALTAANGGATYNAIYGNLAGTTTATLSASSLSGPECSPAQLR